MRIENVENFADIIFLPVCSKCHTVFYGTVDCVPQRIVAVDHRSVHQDYEITPSECPNCKRKFTGIQIPTKLPYTNREL